MEASTTPDSTAHLAEELRALVRERGRKQAHVLRELGWDKSWFSDLRKKPWRLTMPDLLAVLGVLGVEPSDFFDRVHGKGDPAPEVVKVRGHDGRFPGVANASVGTASVSGAMSELSPSSSSR